MKKILCYFFIILTLTTLCVPITAASGYEDLNPLDMDNTSIEYDFNNVFNGDYQLSKYRENKLDENIKFITMAEKGYSKSPNIYNATTQKIGSHKGITLKSGNNLFIASGIPTANDGLGNYYSVEGIKPNITYSFRLKLMEKNNSSGKCEGRFYMYTEKPNLTYISIACAIWSLNGNEAVGTYTFTEEQVAKGIRCGVYFVYDTTSIFDNVTVRADIIEGSYTKDNFPEYRPCGSVSSDYGLYFYLYNPSRKVIIKDTEYDKVTMRSNIDKQGDHYIPYKIKLVDTYNATEETETTTNALILKYKLENYDDFVFTDTIKGRTYELSEVELLFQDEITAKSYKVGSKYTFNEVNGYTYAAFTNTEVVRIEKDNLEFAYYRTPDEGSTDNFHDLQTVFFTVPKEISEKYGELVGVSAIWEECLTKPVLFTNNSEIAIAFQDILGKDVPSDFPYTFGYDFKENNIGYTSSSAVVYYGAFDYLLNPNIDLGGKIVSFSLFETNWLENKYFNNLIDKLYFAEYSEEVFVNDILKSSNDMIKDLDKYKWSDEIFSNIDQSNFDYDEPVHFDTVINKNFVAYRNPNFWGRLIGINNKFVDEIPYSNLSKVDTNLLSKDALFMKNYFISSKNDFSQIKDMYNDNVSKGRTDLYALHFTVTPYITHKVYFYDAEGKKIDTDSLVAQATAIRNFDFIDLTYEKDGVITVLGVQGSPQNTIPDFTGNETYADPSDQLWKEILELLKKDLPILVILVIISIGLKLFQIFKRPKVIIKEKRKKE